MKLALAAIAATQLLTSGTSAPVLVDTSGHLHPVITTKHEAQIWCDGFNRASFFMRAANEGSPHPVDLLCGNGAYSLRIEDDCGKELYRDNGW